MKAFGLLVVAGTLVAGSVAPASAEFFGCNEPRAKVSYSSRAAAYRTSYTRSYAALRQRHAANSSQNSRRFASQWH